MGLDRRDVRDGPAGQDDRLAQQFMRGGQFCTVSSISVSRLIRIIGLRVRFESIGRRGGHKADLMAACKWDHNEAGRAPSPDLLSAVCRGAKGNKMALCSF